VVHHEGVGMDQQLLATLRPQLQLQAMLQAMLQPPPPPQQQPQCALCGGKVHEQQARRMEGDQCFHAERRDCPGQLTWAAEGGTRGASFGAMGGAVAQMPPPPLGELCPPVVAVPPRPTVEQVRARAFGRAAVVAALRAHFPLHWHPALGRNNGEATELKELLLVLLQGGDGGRQPVAAGFGGASFGAMGGAVVQMQSQCTLPQAQTQAPAALDAQHEKREIQMCRICAAVPLHGYFQDRGHCSACEDVAMDTFWTKNMSSNKGVFCIDAAHGHSGKKLKRKYDCYKCSKHNFCVAAAHGHSEQEPKRKYDCYKCSKHNFCVAAAHGHSEQKPKRKKKCCDCSEHNFCVDAAHKHSKKNPVSKSDCYKCSKHNFCVAAAHKHSEQKPKRKTKCYDCSEHNFCVAAAHWHSKQKPVRKEKCYDCSEHNFCVDAAHKHSKKNPVSKSKCYDCSEHNFCVDAAHGHSKQNPVRKEKCYDCSEHNFCVDAAHGHSKQNPVRKSKCYVGSCLRAIAQRMLPGTDLAIFTGITASGPWPVPSDPTANVFVSHVSVKSGFTKAFGCVPAHVLAEEAAVSRKRKAEEQGKNDQEPVQRCTGSSALKKSRTG
jgi:hypothetical protein